MSRRPPHHLRCPHHLRYPPILKHPKRLRCRTFLHPQKRRSFRTFRKRPHQNHRRCRFDQPILKCQPNPHYLMCPLDLRSRKTLKYQPLLVQQTLTWTRPSHLFQRPQQCRRSHQYPHHLSRSNLSCLQLHRRRHSIRWRRRTQHPRSGRMCQSSGRWWGARPDCWQSCLGTQTRWFRRWHKSMDLPIPRGSTWRASTWCQRSSWCLAP